MRKNYKAIAMALAATLTMGMLTGCGSSAAKEDAKITIAYQSSVGYAPLLVMKEKGLIEEAYGKDIQVEWVEMKNGAEINEGLVAGQLDVGTMGVPVAVTGVTTSGMYKIAFGLSSQPYSITTSNPAINSLADITSSDQIAITNINSQPHVLLAMAAKEILGDAHALDANLTKLSNSDGYSAIVSGAVSSHMVISPYNFMEVASTEADIHEIPIDSSIWPAENTALVGVVSNKLVDSKPEIYNALLTAVEKADTFIKENPEETATILAVGYDADASEIQQWITDPRSGYRTELQGVMDMINFMVEEGFMEEGPSDIKEIVFDNVKGN